MQGDRSNYGRRVFVVMGNDYPHSVYATEEAAERFIAAARKARDKETGVSGSRIYWRAYEFPVLEAYKEPIK